MPFVFKIQNGIWFYTEVRYPKVESVHKGGALKRLAEIALLRNKTCGLAWPGESLTIGRTLLSFIGLYRTVLNSGRRFGGRDDA